MLYLKEGKIHLLTEGQHLTVLSEIDLKEEHKKEIQESFSGDIDFIKITNKTELIYEILKAKNKIKNKLTVLDNLKQLVNKKITIICKVVDISYENDNYKKYTNIMLLSELDKRVLSGIVFNEEVKIKKDSYLIVTATLKDDTKKRFKSKNDKILGDYYLAIESFKVLEDVNLKEQTEKRRHLLHAHTVYSRRDAFINENDIHLLNKNGIIDSFSITDHHHIKGFLNLTKNISKLNKDVKINLGCECQFYNDLEEHKDTAKRYDLVLIIKQQDTTIKFDNEDVTVNEGIRALNTMITNANLKHYSLPTTKYSYKRPLFALSDIIKFKKYFIIGSACILGPTTNNFYNNNFKEFFKFLKILDYIEIHPMHNNKFSIENEGFPYINSSEEIKKRNRAMYKIAKFFNKKVVFADDAHVPKKEDRALRKWFKQGQITVVAKKSNKNIDVEKEFTDENQPYVLTYEEVEEELKEQGFKEEEIEDILKSEKELSDICVDARNVTIVPKKLFSPVFENIDAEKEVRKISMDFLLNKYSINNDIKEIPTEILERYNYELEKTLEKKYETLYYLAYLICRKTEEFGKTVGSRGSVGSSFLAYSLGVTENNPIKPHYYCNKCKKVIFLDEKTEIMGIDLENKMCECGGIMIGDGLDIEFSSFVGYDGKKLPDIDLNAPQSLQGYLLEEMIKMFGEENSIRSGTALFFKEDGVFTNILSKIPNLNEKIEKNELDLEYLKFRTSGVLHSGGKHAGGQFIWHKDFDINYATAIEYEQGYPTSTEKVSSLDYHSIDETVLKVDVLGKADPDVFYKLKMLTGIDHRNIELNDKKVFEAINDCSLLGLDKETHITKTGNLFLPELGTNFLTKMIEDLKPQNLTHLTKIEGLSHGEGIWIGNGADLIKDGKTINDIICTRDELFVKLKNFGMPPKEAFYIIEKIRKGKGSLLTDEEHSLLTKFVPSWFKESMLKIKYLFPTAHAYAYAVVAYKAMWYKLYHKEAYYTCVLDNICSKVQTVKMGNGENGKYVIYDLHELTKNSKTKKDIDSIRKILNKHEKQQKVVTDKMNFVNCFFEMRSRGVELSTPKLSISSSTDFVLDKETKTIYPPISFVSGIGEKTAEELYEASKKINLKGRSATSLANFFTINIEKMLEEIDKLPYVQSYNKEQVIENIKKTEGVIFESEEEFKAILSQNVKNFDILIKKKKLKYFSSNVFKPAIIDSILINNML